MAAETGTPQDPSDPSQTEFGRLSDALEDMPEKDKAYLLLLTMVFVLCLGLAVLVLPNGVLAESPVGKPDEIPSPDVDRAQ